MKIAIATDDNIHVTGHIGRVKYFLIYTINENKIIDKEIRDNTFTNHSKGINHGNHEHHLGEGHRHGHQRLVEGLKDCKVLIFNSGGWRVIDDLKANNIYPFLTDEHLADKAVEKYLNNELIEKENNVCSEH